MPYDPTRKLMTPDFLAPEMQGWVGMEDDQSAPDFNPLANAFQQRFMQKSPAGAHPDMPHSDVTPTVAPHLGGEMAGHEAKPLLSGAGKTGGFKSL